MTTAVIAVGALASCSSGSSPGSGSGASATPPVTPTPTVPPTSGPSGQAMPVGDLPGWHQVFAENFDTPVALGSWPGPYRSRFTSYSGAPDTAKIGYWDARATVSVGPGYADYYLHTVNGVPQAAAILPTTAPQTYGRYSVRFRVDAGLAGWASAWLLWPDDGLWPAHGEIDWPEGELTGSMTGNMHHADPAGGMDGVDSHVAFDSGWHTATTEWTQGMVRFFLDGELVGTTTQKVPTTPMHWVLQSETAYGARPAPDVAGHIQIDWLVQYRQKAT